MNRKMIFLMVLIISIMQTGLGFAAGEETSGDYMKDMGNQFVRGLGNVITSPAEIPCTIGNDLSANSSTGFFTGLGKGTVFMLRRILVGVCEVGTFMIPSQPTLPPVCQTKK